MKYRHHPFQIKVTTLSPLHIGNGETLSSTGEYLTTSDAIYFLNHKDLMKKLQVEGVFESYLEKIVQDRENFDFYKVLKHWSIDPLQFKEREIRLYQAGLNPASNNILHQHIKTAEQAYIPGSTLKGLFRHAIITNILSNNKKLLDAIDTDIQKQIENGGSLSSVTRYWTRKEKELVDGALFKSLQVSDSTGVDDISLAIYQIQRQSMIGQVSEGLDWLEECIAPESSLSFVLTYYLPEQINFSDGDFYKTKSPNALFRLLNNWTKFVLDEEIALVDQSKIEERDKAKIKQQLKLIQEEVEQAEDNFAVARIGKGKTIFFQTLFPILSARTKSLLIDLISKTLTEVFPASRVLSVKDRLTKGWIKLEYQKPERKLFDNEIQSELKIGTELRVYWVKKKTVEGMINGQYYADIQLINKYKQPFEVGQLITVEVQQLTKDKRVNQVKIKS